MDKSNHCQLQTVYSQCNALEINKTKVIDMLSNKIAAFETTDIFQGRTEL